MTAYRGLKAPRICGSSTMQMMPMAPSTRKPHENDRAEQRRYPGRSAALHGKEADQNEQRKRHHRFLKRRGDDLEPLYGGYHRECRRDGGVPVKERRTGNAEEENDVPAATRHRLGERHERERTALPVEVRAQKKAHILQRDEQEQ